MLFKKIWIESIQGLPIDLQDKIISEAVRDEFKMELQYKDDIIIQAFVNLIRNDREKDLI